MSDISVDYGQLNMASELLERQTEHIERMRGHVQTHCRIPSSGFGLLLQLLHPLNELVVDTADKGLELLGSMSTWGAVTMDNTLDAYVESDRNAYERARQLMTALGHSLPPFSDPRGSLPALGSAASTAPADYGQRQRSWHPGMDTELHFRETAQSAVDLITSTADGVVSRANTLTSRGGVVERTDPTSYLVPPSTSENFVEELRWKAGLIIGSVDWVAEQFLGYSALNEYVFKPFGGDWHAMGAATQAWSHVDRALMETGSNFSGLPGQVDSWNSEASVAFMGAMAGFSAASGGMSVAGGFISTVMSKVAQVAKGACALIALLLKTLSRRLLSIAAKAAVPVAGWILLTIDVIIIIERAIAIAGLIKKAIDSIIDAISDFVSAREKIVQAVFMVEDLVNAAAHKAVRI